MLAKTTNPIKSEFGVSNILPQVRVSCKGQQILTVLSARHAEWPAPALSASSEALQGELKQGSAPKGDPVPLFTTYPGPWGGARNGGKSASRERIRDRGDRSYASQACHVSRSSDANSF
jgi:hypothetical protein